MSKKKKKKIFLIDGNSLCYRAFYAIKELSTSSGVPTNAVYGVINMLKKIQREHEPGGMVFVFDMPGPTTRHEKYEEYKIQRTPMPDSLAEQLSKIKEVIAAYNIPICQLKGYEADDIIATLSEKVKKKGYEVVIVTSDKDALQLVCKDVNVLSAHTLGDKMYGGKEVKEKYGVSPDEMIELMALMGDSSDNIPGVAGIGKVTAEKLISKFGTVKEVYKNIDKITSESVKKKLEEGKDMAELSRELAILQRDVPVDLDIKAAEKAEPDTEKLTELFKELEFGKLLREIAPKEDIASKKYEISEAGESEKRLKELGKKKMVALYVDGDPLEGKIGGAAFSAKEGEAFYVSFKDSSKLKEVLEDEKIIKAGYDLKETIRLLGKNGIDLKGEEFDIMIADYLVDPSMAKYGLSDIAMRRADYNLLEESSVEWEEGGQATLDFSGKKEEVTSCERSDVILKLYGILKPMLEEKHLKKLFEEVEMPLVKVLSDMEEEGVGIDVKYLKDRSSALEKKLQEVTKKIYKLAGEEFNINSPKQLQEVLYDKLGLPVTKRTKTGRSTDESVLRKLAEVHELPRDLLEYREMNKLKTGYYDSIASLADKKTNKLHAYFNQAVTATGRLSSSEPNLQNIPIKTKLGREIRKVFIPGEKGMELIAADYSQVELRVLAHLSGDKKLIKAFKDEEDVHRFTASLIFDSSLKDVDDKMRSAAKTVNFGIIYGMSPFGLAKDLEISVEEAHKFISSYFKRYSGVSEFIEKTITQVRKKGYVTTLLNRRRYIPEIKSKNERLKSFAERAAVNTIVQGTAADLIKVAMIQCHEAFQEEKTKMLIQVHDELVFKSPKTEVKASSGKIKRLMESVIDLKVPLKVDVECGENWLEMKSVKL